MAGPIKTRKTKEAPYYESGLLCPFQFVDFPEPARKTIYDYQAELDETCPEWRNPALKIGAYPVDTLIRIRWLLKRHELLTRRTYIDTGNGTGRSVPNPCDWEVVMRVMSPTKIMAEPVNPAHSVGYACPFPGVMRVIHTGGAK